LAEAWARGASKIIGDPLLISATVEASNFKFGIQLGFGTILPKTRLGPKLADAWAREHPKKFGTTYLFLKPLKLATEKLVHNMSSGLPCQTQVLGPNWVGSELGEYHSPPHYDDDATVYSACHQKLTGTQISLLSGIKKKI